MPLLPRRLVLLSPGAALVAVACSTGAPSRPPELGNCVPVDDARCTLGTNGAGAPGGPGGGGQDGGFAEPDGGALGCGLADGLLNLTNNTCATCIQSSCCLADLECTGSCLQLLQCVEACAATNASCLTACGNAFGDGTTSYDDLGGCLTLNCSPECPTLPSTTQSDF